MSTKKIFLQYYGVKSQLGRINIQARITPWLTTCVTKPFDTSCSLAVLANKNNTEHYRQSGGISLVLSMLVSGLSESWPRGNLAEVIVLFSLAGHWIHKPKWFNKIQVLKLLMLNFLRATCAISARVTNTNILAGNHNVPNY